MGELARRSNAWSGALATDPGARKAALIAGEHRCEEVSIAHLGEGSEWTGVVGQVWTGRCGCVGRRDVDRRVEWKGMRRSCDSPLEWREGVDANRLRGEGVGGAGVVGSVWREGVWGDVRGEEVAIANLL